MISAKRASTRRRLRRALLGLALAALGALCLPVGAAAAPAGPVWKISIALTEPTNLVPGDNSGEAGYEIVATNVGSEPTYGSVTITDELPEGLSVAPAALEQSMFRPPFEMVDLQEEHVNDGFYRCDEATVSCSGEIIVQPGQKLFVFLPVDVAADAPPLLANRVRVSGGGAPGDSAVTQNRVSSEPAPFGFERFESALLDEAGAAEARAGAHPFQLRIGGQLNLVNYPGEGGVPTENAKDIIADLPAGLVVDPEATPVRCTEVQLLDNECPDAAAVGEVAVTLNVLANLQTANIVNPIYNMVPPQGHPAEFGFNVAGIGVPIHLLAKVRSDGDYGLSSETLDVPTIGNMSGVAVELWGDPSDHRHDYMRGQCGAWQALTTDSCPVLATHTALLTMPTACSGPLVTNLSADSWQNRGHFITASAETEKDTGDGGEAVGVSGCEKLNFDPQTETTLSTDQGETGTAFDLKVNMPNDGLEDSRATAESMVEKAVVTLPEGVTINPSVGESLGYCTPPQYAKEQTFSSEGEGCPNDSKLGTVSIETPLLKNQTIEGSVYLAQQDNPETTEPGAENPFDTDIALYMVLRNTKLGVMVKKPIKVVPDPQTGQLVATMEDIPQIPFSHFDFHFKEGARAALISPAACGKYTTVSRFYPSSDPSNPKTVTADFEITKGVGGGPCPPGGVPPFHPDFQAGSLNNSAGSFSPFDMQLIRHDGEQDMTKFSATLPPGVLGSLAGVAKCPDSAIADAKGKTGRQEKAAPSCPANSLIGHTIAGAGVGDSLTYVPGYVYLGGPYHGDPLSVIAITPALAGPFDAGAIVVQEALTLNPKTAEVEVDGASSDPIPHILKGIVLKVRELRVHVDRPNFTLNPTNCAESSARSTLWGANLNLFSPADDDPVGLSTRYQASDCQALGYRPHLALKLKGGTRRGAHPALRAIYRPRKGDANTKGLIVRLPRSAFLDQAHIRTICTRVQFAAGAGNGEQCPKGAQYGYVRAWTPLLDEPLEGPVFLRSSNHKLPDMVLALHGLVNVEVTTRLDSKNGGIRATVEEAPDAPLSKVLLRMQGAKKGLVVNSRNLCFKPKRNHAHVLAAGHNGRRSTANPLMRAQCGKARHKAKKHGRHRRRG